MAGELEMQPETQSQQGLSLRALSEAFAQAMHGKKTDPPAAQPAGESGAAPGPAHDEAPVAELVGEPPLEDQCEPDSDPVEVSPLTILEAMLFVGNRANESLTADVAASIMRGVQPDDIPGLVESLNRRYAAGGCPYHVVGAGPGYRITLRREYGPLRNLFYGRLREARLSQAAIDVLAIVAYQQPLTAEQVTKLRGRPSGHILAQLVRRQILRIERPAGQPRRTHYFTTDRFLALFGLESLDDLPRTEDLEKR